MNRDLDIFARFIKKYKLICLIVALLLLVQVFLAIRVVLIGNDNQVSKDLGSSSTSGAKKLKSGHGHEDSYNNNVASQGHKSNQIKDYEDGDYRPPVSDTDTDADLLDEKDSSEHLKTHAQPVLTQSKSSSPSPASELDLVSLDFVPECQITNKESISAIQRAKTQECKEELAKVACQGPLYPTKLPRYCKHSEFTYMKHNGCYQDEQKNRILPDHFALLKLSNSPQNCVDMCLQSGYSFAGVQYSIECFCGNKRPSDDLLLPLDECNMKCPSSSSTKNQSRICGGYFRMNVYATGVFNLSGDKDVKGLDDVELELSGYSSNPTIKKAGIVFFLTLNGRATRQVIRLIKTLFRKQHYFYIHVDARQDYMFRELQILKDTLPDNIHFMASREATIWGGASLLTVLLNGMKDLIDNSKNWGWDWGYVINLSESDFPLKTVEQLETFLALNNGRNFVKSHGRDAQKFITKQGLDRTFVECEHRMWRLQDRKLPAGILFDGGSDWIALHRDFIHYVVNTEDELVRGLRIVYRNTLLPAESFFHTILRNSAFCETFVDNNLHVTNWKRKLGCKCQYKSVVDWCGCSPNDFRLSDWSRLELADSKLIFFGRKFEPIVNQAVVNKLKLKLDPNHRDYGEFAILDKYWQSIYNQRETSPKPKDSILTLGHSLARISTAAFLKSFVEHHEGSISYKNADVEVNVEDLHVFVQNDRMEGVLVKFEAHLPENVNLKLEAWFKSQPGWARYEPEARLGKFGGKFQNLRVGEDYDQKEQIFRNYAGILGSHSEPALAYNLYTDESFNVSFVWINPDNRVISTINMVVNSGDTASFVKPTLKAPLTPGNWTVRVQTPSRQVIALITFLISPMEFQDGVRVEADKDLERLQSRIDSLVESYYELQDLCFVKPISQILLATMDGNVAIADGHTLKHQSQANGRFEADACKETAWSSLYPDPKSVIEGIDPATGLLLP